MAQAPYPPLLEPPDDNLIDTKKTTSKKLARAPSLINSIDSWKRRTLGALLEAVIHLAEELLQH